MEQLITWFWHIGFWNQVLLIWFFSINVVTFFAFGFDKTMAVLNRRRIPEATLLGMALIGGAFGGALAMEFFRHKTKKTSFFMVLILFLLIQLGLVGFLIFGR